MKNKTVLVLDDSRVVLDTLDVKLGEAGFTVLSAANLTEFDAQCAKQRPDIFVLDIQMPEAFGDDVGRVLRQMRQVAVPIVLFSSVPDEELAKRAADAELDGWVSKRAGVGALIARLTELVGSASGALPVE